MTRALSKGERLLDRVVDGDDDRGAVAYLPGPAHTDQAFRLSGAEGQHLHPSRQPRGVVLEPSDPFELHNVLTVLVIVAIVVCMAWPESWWKAAK